ncbi:MAG: aminotransferase class I/II-fold pyridoxal phosphate-dependent enzyme [Lachnospiraceae bacterium]|nr:aminotransferase class I/II-fold pyridoxal phosphate-dependent enzyme [Lachnospiraceae bacterium]
MKDYKNMSREELLSLKDQLTGEYEAIKQKGLSLNMARGKPSPSQLDLSMGMLDAVNSGSDVKANDGLDCRNYGEMDGIYEAKKLLGDMIGACPENVIVCGNASLPIMYDTVARSMLSGVNGMTPWSKLDRVRFLCPVPGYDRHFAITENFGIEMINIPMDDNGPDMKLVKEYAENDETIKGIWCVPKYSNPTGITYSDEVVKAFANLKPKAHDFRIYWDNAYAVHDLYDNGGDKLLNILEECSKAGNEDLVYEFCSTSKISFAGSGIAGVATSKANLEWIKKSMMIQTIGYDKINQLRHVLHFKDLNGIRKRMTEHASITRPKFEAVYECFERELAGLGIGTWTKPNGGYFISFNALPGCAKDIVARCREAGMITTGAGATYPYKKDPEDKNIRIAPTFPSLSEIKTASEVFALCVKLSSIDKFLSDQEL